MKTIVMILCLVVMGCGFSVAPEDWNKCEKVCKKNDGIRLYMNAEADKCICNNGVSIRVDSIKGEQ